MLEIKDLHVTVEGKEILKGINLQFMAGEVHALMGPNGSGKSTLALAVMGHPKYAITKGKIILDGKDITAISPDERAKAGLFLSFQHPLEIPGVNVSTVLRAATNAVHTKQYSVLDFHKLLMEKMEIMKIPASFSKRGMHEGFSGGEKKRVEILQLLLLEPRYALLDETDSGLDVDALKVVAQGIEIARKNKHKLGIIVITHYHRFLEYLQPDKVSVMIEGKIVAEGGKELAQKIEKDGFAGVKNNGH